MKSINHKKHNRKVLCMVSVLFILIFTKSGRVDCRLRTLWKIHKYFDFCHTIVTKRA